MWCSRIVTSVAVLALGCSDDHDQASPETTSGDADGDTSSTTLSETVTESEAEADPTATTEVSSNSTSVGLDTSSAEASTSTGADACPAGTADCNGDPDDGCEADLASDGENCGTCEHGCLGTGCELGFCTRIPLVEAGSVGSIALDATHVYYVVSDLGDRLRRIPKNGGADEDLETFFTEPTGMRLTSAYVYLLAPPSPFTIVRIPKDGGEAEDVVLDVHSDIYVVDDERIYFDDFGLKSMTVDGGDLVAHDDVPIVNSLGIDDGFVYIGGETSLDRLDKATFSVEQIVADADPWHEIVPLGDQLYWQQGYVGTFDCATESQVMVADIDGNNVDMLASLAAPWSLAPSLDAVYVRACDGDDASALLRIPPGGAPAAAAASLATPDQVLADDVSIYWNDGGTAIYKQVK
jgi:hypothetical protein